ncbi:hypothetical protein O6P43_028495 [Quillaja saponaria]|uniref:Uncharacterized protein n=1 Tax=Quillaja saponaria TaxID=32244 RepID=A0AAD7P9Z6_QUISA|nr:hypothetical protein O6P43_028495 [Quillaja saponaria]
MRFRYKIVRVLLQFSQRRERERERGRLTLNRGDGSLHTWNVDWSRENEEKGLQKLRSLIGGILSAIRASKGQGNKLSIAKQRLFVSIGWKRKRGRE